MNDETLEKVVSVIRDADYPLNVGEVASKAKLSRPTASKYIQIARALGRLDTWADATQQLVALPGKARHTHRRRRS